MSGKKLPFYSSYHLYDHSLENYPELWWEKLLSGKTFILPLVVIVMIACGLWRLQVSVGLYPNVWLSLAGIACLSVGYLADVLSTEFTSRFLPRFIALGLEYPLDERNPLLPRVPRLKDILFSWDVLIHIGVLIVVFIIPSAGLMGLTLHSLVALHNLRQQKRLDWTLKLVEKGD